MRERRHLRRRYTIYYIKVFDHNTKQLTGRLVNINTGGMMLVSEKPIKPGEHFQFKMPLPDPIRGVKELSLDARSVWCGQDVNTDFFDTGFEFIEPPHETVSIIRDSFESYLFHDWSSNL